MSFTALTFLVMFIGGLALALLRSPIYGLYVYIAVFYLDPPSRWWAAQLPDLRWSYTAAVVTLMVTLLKRAGREGSPVYSHAPVWLFSLLVCYMWIRTPWAVDQQQNWFELLIFTKYLVVIYLIYALVDSREHLVGFLNVHALGCLYLGIVAWSVGGGGRLDGVGGPGINDASSLSMQFATGVFAAAGVFFATMGWRRILPLVVVPFALNGLVLTGSRGGFLALLAGGVTFYLMRPRIQSRRVTPYVIGAALLIGYLASESFLERVSTLTKPVEVQADEDLGVATRLELLSAQWRMTIDHPLGAGAGGTEALSMKYLDPIHWSTLPSGEKAGRASHSSVMSAMVDQGFPGLIVWLAIMMAILQKLWNNYAWTRLTRVADLAWINAGVTAMFTVVVVAGLFSPQQRTEVYVWVLAAACALSNLTSNVRVQRRWAESQRQISNS